MGLLIRQGEHKEDEILKTKEPVHAKIESIKLAERQDNALTVTFKVITDGKLKGKTFNDLIFFDPEHPASFKYRALRRSAKVPYKKDEPAQIDIEKLLLNKTVLVELDVREYNGRDLQDVKYVAQKATQSKEGPKEAKAEDVAEEAGPADDVPELDDDELAIPEEDDDDPFGA